MYPIVFATAGGQYVPLSFTDSIWLKLISEENRVCFSILKELLRHHRASADFSIEIANEFVTKPLWDKQFEELSEPVTKEQVRLYFRHLLDKGLVVCDYDKRDDSLQISITDKGIISAVSNQFLTEGKDKLIKKWKSFLSVFVSICAIGTFAMTIYKTQIEHKQQEQILQEHKQLKLGLEASQEELQLIHRNLPQIEESVINLETYIDSLKKNSLIH